MHTKVTKLPKSSARIEGELPAADFERYRSEAVKHLAEARDIPGFRKGAAPESVLVRHYGDMAVLEEMAELALRDLYPKLVADEKLDVIGAPKISITKIAKGAPLGFAIETALVPDVKMPDWKSIGKDIPRETPEAVTDEEVETLFAELKARDGESEAKATNDDELAKRLGNFPDAAALRAKIKENLGLEKEHRALEKRRIALLDALAEKTDADIPDILVESELERMVARLGHDLERHKISFADYLTRVGKSEADLKAEWRPSAEKNVKIELALGKIAEAEKVVPDEKALDAETKHFLEHSPGVPEDRAREYIASLMTKDLVMAKLLGTQS